MFLEVTKTVFLKLKPALEENNISFQASDCSIEGEKDELGNTFECVHLEFGNITKKMASFIAKLTDNCYGLVAVESKTSSELNRPIDYTNEGSYNIEIH